MKYVTILCVSLFSVMAFAATAPVDENPGGRAEYPSSGESTASPAVCNCNANGAPSLAMAGDGVTNTDSVTPGGNPAPQVAPTEKARATK
jgi:hypothetical protein